LRSPLADAVADPLYVHLVARARPPNFYANSEDRRYFSLYNARRMMRAAAVALLVVGSGWSGLRFVQGVLAADGARALDRQAAFYQRRYEVARQQMPATEVEPEELRIAVEAVRQLERHRATPREMMLALSAGLADEPRLRIEEIDWAAANRPDAAVGRSGGGAEDGRQSPAEDGALYQVAAVRGRIDPFDGDYRGAIDAVNGFADRLSGVDGVSAVQVLRLPLDLSSQASLSGRTEAPGRIAEFELRLGLRVAGTATGAAGG